MTPEKLFHELLGLGLSWEVTACHYDRSPSQVLLQVRETSALWQHERCPKDGGRVSAYDHTEPLRWRHLNVFEHECESECRLPRGRAAATLGETDQRLWRRLAALVDRAYTEADFSQVTRIGGMN